MCTRVQGVLAELFDDWAISRNRQLTRREARGDNYVELVSRAENAVRQLLEHVFTRFLQHKISQRVASLERRFLAGGF